MKVFKEHVHPESQSIASSKAAQIIASGKSHDRMAKVDLAQLVAYRLKKRPDDCQSTASIFYNHQQALHSKYHNSTGCNNIIFYSGKASKADTNSVFNQNRMDDVRST